MPRNHGWKMGDTIAMHRRLRSLRRAALPQLFFALCSPACVAPTHVAEAPGPSAELRLGFWNVRKLGQDEAKDAALLCTLIAEQFDVIALAEVMADDPTGDVASLRACLGVHFTLLETPSPRPRGAQPYREHGWLGVRPERATACAGRPGLLYAEPPTFDTQADFLRPPAFACLELAGGGQLFVGVYHARWGTGDPDEVMREVALLDDVLAEVPRALAGPENVLLFGDLNLTPADVARATGLRVHTSGRGSTLSPNGEPTDHLYDQLLVAPSTALVFGEAEVLDLRDRVGGARNYHRLLSDHLPIRALLGGPAKSPDHGPLGSPMPYPRPSE